MAMFVISYGSLAYFKARPQLSINLIDRLLELGVSVIGHIYPINYSVNSLVNL